MLRAVVLTVSVLLVMSTGALPRADSHEPRDLEGFRVLVDRSLLATDAELAKATLCELEHQLYAIGRVVPAPALARLREVEIWVNRESKTRCMAYHPSKQWLENNEFDPRLAKAVELGNPTTFLAWTKVQPWMVLHELAHAYHDRVLGFEHAEVRAAFAQAKDDARWQRVLYHDGNEVEPYALTDPKEFFAELSEALFGTNDFHPFVRAELRAGEPAAHALLCRLWGVRA